MEKMLNPRVLVILISACCINGCVTASVSRQPITMPSGALRGMMGGLIGLATFALVAGRLRDDGAFLPWMSAMPGINHGGWAFVILMPTAMATMMAIAFRLSYRVFPARVDRR